MPQISNALSDRTLRAWVALGRPIAKADGGGLTFTLSASGTAAWVLRYRHGGRRRELTLGRYPDLSLKQARLDAAEARVRISKGADVAVEKQQDRARTRAAWTVRDVVRDFERKRANAFADGTWRNTRAYIDRDVLPRFGAWLARDVTAQAAQEWLEGIAKGRGYQAAANARKAAILIGDHATARHVAHANPFRAVSLKTVAEKPATRQRVKLSDDELQTFLRALPALPEEEGLALRLLLLTGCRANELFRAEWADFDIDAGVWRMPRAKIKTRKGMHADAFEIRLPIAAVEWFKRLRVLARGSRWLLPSPATDDDAPLSYDTHVLRLRAFITTLKGFPAITHHDLRSTARSYWSEMGTRTEVCERMLNHSLGGLVQVYDKGDYSDERAAALQKWAAKLIAIEHDKRAKVVAIRKRS